MDASWLCRLAIILVWSRQVPRYHGIDFLALAGILIGGFPIFKEALPTCSRAA